jgi:hypothetical protein
LHVASCAGARNPARQVLHQANRDGIFYEFNRHDGTLTYASSTTQDGVTTTMVGSGHCAIFASSDTVKAVFRRRNKTSLVARMACLGFVALIALNV